MKNFLVRYALPIGAFLLIAIGVTLIFAGCSVQAEYGGSNFDVQTVEVDGRMVTCIVMRTGISCDW